jgi:protein gp37
VGEQTKIPWCHHTFNGWLGCEKVSDACAHCYAEVTTPVNAYRAKGLELWGHGAARQITGKAVWRAPMKWDREAREAGERRRVFAFSLADVFEDRRDLDMARRDFFSLVVETPNLDWLVLTKRIDRVLDLVPSTWRTGGFPRNWWQGVTVESERGAHTFIDDATGKVAYRPDEHRLRWLARIPSVVRFVSCEPMLDRINFDPWLDAFDWIIFGGESGRRPRDFSVPHLRNAMWQCESKKIFVKQVGARPIIGAADDGWPTVIVEGGAADQVRRPILIDRRHGEDPAEWPEDLRVRKFPTPRAA